MSFTMASRALLQRESGRQYAGTHMTAASLDVETEVVSPERYPA